MKEPCWVCTKEDKQIKLKDPSGQFRSYCKNCVGKFAYLLSSDDVEKNKQEILKDLLKLK